MASRKQNKVKRTKFQRFKEIEIHRDQLKNAPYNPRTISAAAKAKLKKNIKEVGLLALPVWNKRTGNIVSGHQRVAALDALEKSYDYCLRVAVVDLDEKQEKEQNVFMNNSAAQGEYDAEALDILMKDLELDNEAMGFDAVDTIKMIGLESASGEDVLELAKKLKTNQKKFEKNKVSQQDKNAVNFYLVVVFKNDKSRLAFTNRLGLPDNKYVAGEDLLNRLEVPDTGGHGN